MRSRGTTTYCDILRYRELDIKKDFKDGEWTKVINDDDFSTLKRMSPAGKKIQDAIAKSVKEMRARREAEERFTRPSEEEKDDFY